MTTSSRRPRLAMVAYTHYETDPRVRREAEALAQAGWGVDVLALRRPGQSAHDMLGGVDVHRLNQDRYRGASGARYIGAYLKFMVRAGWWLLRATRRRRLRLIHVHTMPDFMIGAALWPRLIHRLPVILDIHDTMPEIFAEKFQCSPNHWKIRMLRLQEVMSTRIASAVVTSEHTKAELLVHHGVNPDKITVVLNLPDPEVFGAPEEPAAPEDRSCFRMAYHGTLAHRLGLDIALRALASVREQMDEMGPWRFEILGEGDARGDLIALRDSLGLGERIWFSDGFVPTPDLRKNLRGVALGLVPSRSQRDTAQMLPTKLVEYVHLGIPAIARPTTTVRHYFDEGQVMMVDSDDPKRWGEAILALRSDPDGRRAQALRARAWAVEHQWSTHRQVLIDLAERLTRRRWPEMAPPQTVG